MRKTPSAEGWDWELLARQLQQPHVFSPFNTPLQLPQGLRNGRRIWRLLELAWVGDVVSQREDSIEDILEKKMLKELKVKATREGEGAAPASHSLSLSDSLHPALVGSSFSAPHHPLAFGGASPFSSNLSSPFHQTTEDKEPSRILLVPGNDSLQAFLPVPVVFEL